MKKERKFIVTRCNESGRPMWIQMGVKASELLHELHHIKVTYPKGTFAKIEEIHDD